MIYGPCNYIAVRAMEAVELVSGFGGVLVCGVFYQTKSAQFFWSTELVNCLQLKLFFSPLQDHLMSISEQSCSQL